MLLTCDEARRCAAPDARCAAAAACASCARERGGRDERGSRDTVRAAAKIMENGNGRQNQGTSSSNSNGQRGHTAYGGRRKYITHIMGYLAILTYPSVPPRRIPQVASPSTQYMVHETGPSPHCQLPVASCQTHQARLRDFPVAVKRARDADAPTAGREPRNIGRRASSQDKTKASKHAVPSTEPRLPPALLTARRSTPRRRGAVPRRAARGWPRRSGAGWSRGGARGATRGGTGWRPRRACTRPRC